MNLEELERKKQELEESLAQLTAQIKESKLAEHAAQNPVIISDIRVDQGRVFFKSTYREDFVNYLRTIPDRKWNGAENSIPIETWKSFEESTKSNVQNVQFHETYDPATYKAPSSYIVSLAESSIHITLGPNQTGHILRTLPGAESHYLKERTYYSIPLTEAWRLVSLFEGILNVQYETDTLEFIETQLEQRKKLDEVVKSERVELGINLNGQTLRDFQTVGVRFAEVSGYNCLIADEMGLGKTPQALAALRLLDEKLGNGAKYLIVCPAAVKANWGREFKKFLDAEPYELYGEFPSSVDAINLLKGDYKYYLINYDILSTMYIEKSEYKDEQGFMHNKSETRMPWIELINMSNFKAVILDEAHKIKNVDAKRTRAVKELQIPHRILLTGSPMLNRPPELHPLISFINPRLVGPYETFVRRYTYDKKTARNVDELREILKPIMIRRVKKDVMKELPPINRINHIVELSSEARTRYNKVLDGFWSELDAWDGKPQSIQSILVQILRLKQVCAWDNIEKTADLALELSDSMKDAEEEFYKVLIFTQFVNDPECVNGIRTRLADVGALSVTGQMHPGDRLGVIDRFQNEPDINFLICSIQAAGEGLNITKAGAVIFNDLMWTPASHHQAEGRAYGRISEPHSINSYYMICQNTIMEDIIELLAAKLAMFNEIIEGTEASRDASVVMELISKLRMRRASR